MDNIVDYIRNYNIKEMSFEELSSYISKCISFQQRKIKINKIKQRYEKNR
jgi:hypothetical protein